MFVKTKALIRFELAVCFLMIGIAVNAQTVLTIEKQTYTNSDDTWMGVNIPRSVPTIFTFRNNSITSINRSGYMLQAGDEGIAATNNNLAGAIITGNKFLWGGTDMTSITHGLFAGNNLNAVIKFNYLDKVPMGIIRKSASNMINTAGGIAYNIIKNGAVAINIKGMSNVSVYNNTLYTDRTTSQTWRGLIDIYTNTSVTPNSVSHGTKVYNNIFYTRFQTYCIQIDDVESLTGFESDYNIFFCETGTPMFDYCGTPKTFGEWQALGYDTHSKVINPNFKDFVNFVPSARLDYGTDLGSQWAEGLSQNARWGIATPETVLQNGKWQVGAIVFAAPIVEPAPIPLYTGSLIKNETPSSLEMTYNLTLANVIPSVTAFTVKVNSVVRNVSAVSISGTKVVLTITSPVVFGDVVTVAYTKPSSNPLQTAAGGQPASLAAQTVTNNCTQPVNRPPDIIISSPVKSTSFMSPANITIDAVASDSDGTITRVEFYSGSAKLGEKTAPPWSYTWKDVQDGTYSLTAAATDNSNSRTVSAAVSVTVEKATQAINQNPVVAISAPVHNSSFEVPAIITLTSSASDNDGSVSKVEYYIGPEKIGESLVAPYTFSFQCDSAGIFEITAVASDNLSATASSVPISILLKMKRQYPEPLTLYPNPNYGHFTVNLNSIPEAGEQVTISIISFSGRTIYNEMINGPDTSRQIDISDSYSGNYIIMTAINNRILSTTQFIKL